MNKVGPPAAVRVKNKVAQYERRRKGQGGTVQDTLYRAM
jgi:hypothetical protein